MAQAQQNQGQQQTQAGAEAAAGEAEGDALDALDAALADDAAAAGEGAEAAEWKAPTQEQWEAQQAAHKKALEAEQGKLKRAREQAKRLREGKSADGGAAESGEEGTAASGPDPKLAVWQRRAVRTAAESALKDRGARPEFAKLALNELNAAEVEFDRNDEPELDEWLDEMEERYPALFVKEETATAQTGRQAMGSVDQGRAAKGAGTAKKKSYGEQVLDNARRAQGRR